MDASSITSRVTHIFLEAYYVNNEKNEPNGKCKHILDEDCNSHKVICWFDCISLLFEHFVETIAGKWKNKILYHVYANKVQQILFSEKQIHTKTDHQ